MPKVSVIVPVYGVEKYIERCARSLFEQTLDDLEFIFVDDCSTDSSMKILEDVMQNYLNRKQSVKVVHHSQNKGLPQARKTGLSFAEGEYVVHCDSDDWVDCRLYEAMYEAAISRDADIVVCDYVVVKPDVNEFRVGTREQSISNYKINMLFQRNSISMWNKMIKRSIYENAIVFPNHNMGEDMATTLQLVRFCKNIAYVEGVYYHYDGTSMSITREETKQAALNRALQACANAHLVINAYSNEAESEIKDGITHLKFMQRRLFMPIINYSDVYEIWKNTFPEINRSVLFRRSVKISFYERMKFFLTLINVFPIVKGITRKNLV